MRRPLSSIIIRKWDPRRLGSALALWIDPSDVSTMLQSSAGTGAMVTDTSVCGYAVDKSGTSFHLTSAADDTTRPTWNLNAGFPYLDFDGTNDILIRAADLGMYAAGSVSIFAAVRANPAVSARLVTSGASASNNPSYSLLESLSSTASTRTQLIRDDANTTITVSGNTTSFFNNSDQVIGITDDGSNLIPYVNTTAQTTRTYTRSGTYTFNRFALGGWQRGAALSWFATRVYGLVIVNRVITGTERSSVITYLGAKAGLLL